MVGQVIIARNMRGGLGRFVDKTADFLQIFVSTIVVVIITAMVAVVLDRLKKAGLYSSYFSSMVCSSVLCSIFEGPEPIFSSF